MKQKFIFLTLLNLFFIPNIFPSNSNSSSPVLETNINWDQFMSKQDMTWEVLP